MNSSQLTMASLDNLAPSPVLNPTLYDRMVKMYGSVIVAKQGEAMYGGGLDFDGMRTSYKPLTSGEYYRINCFAGETLVATKYGDKPISALVGTAELLVPNAKGLGSWRSVEVRSFGKQRLLRLTIKRHGTVRNIRVTADHRWLLSGGNGCYQEATTSSLVQGDKLASCFARKLVSYGSHMPAVSPFGVARGFVFGDGSTATARPQRPAWVDLHGEKDKALLPFFSMCCAVDVGPAVVRIGGLPRQWKSVPYEVVDLTTLCGWLAGYFAADGSVSKPGTQAVLGSANLEGLQFARGVCYQLGIRISPVRKIKRSSNGCVPNACDFPYYEFSFPASDVPIDFWIIAEHRRRVQAAVDRNVSTVRAWWTVEAVEDDGDEDEVFCAIVPGDEKFTLANNLLTRNCPFCLKRGAVDTKHRLWINHRWGVGLDPDNEFYDPNDKFWWMAVCYNENCLDNPEYRRTLRTSLYAGVGRENHGEVVKILPGKTDSGALGVVDYPGNCQLLNTLPHDHKAYQYMLGRGLSPEMLGEEYGVAYCHESLMTPVAAAKIIIPIHMDGKMVSWQARPPYDIDWKAARQPKYYNCPGTNKRLMLYGAQQSMDMKFCIVVEGVTDVWAIGAGAVSVLGKVMSMQQAVVINKLWPVAILVLDAGTAVESNKMRDLLTHGGTRVVTVEMPEGLDPASIDRDYLFDLLYGAASTQGVDLLTL